MYILWWGNGPNIPYSLFKYKWLEDKYTELTCWCYTGESKNLFIKGEGCNPKAASRTSGYVIFTYRLSFILNRMSIKLMATICQICSRLSGWRGCPMFSLLLHQKGHIKYADKCKTLVFGGWGHNNLRENFVTMDPEVHTQANTRR